jgi:hypothetical protein
LREITMRFILNQVAELGLFTKTENQKQMLVNADTFKTSPQNTASKSNKTHTFSLLKTT